MQGIGGVELLFLCPLRLAPQGVFAHPACNVKRYALHAGGWTFVGQALKLDALANPGLEPPEYQVVELAGFQVPHYQATCLNARCDTALAMNGRRLVRSSGKP
jgi:hypothetical protein